MFWNWILTNKFQLLELTQTIKTFISKLYQLSICIPLRFKILLYNFKEWNKLSDFVIKFKWVSEVSATNFSSSLRKIN